MGTGRTARSVASGLVAAATCVAAVVIASSPAAADAGPTVTALSVSSAMPGTVVGVEGSGFLGGCIDVLPQVEIGASVVTALSGATDSLVHFQVPVVRDGLYDVQVIDCAGAASPPVAADQLTITLPPRPAVKTVSPKTGTVGTTITLTGTNLRLYCTDGRIPSVVVQDPNVLGDKTVIRDGDPGIVSWSDTKLVMHMPVHVAAVVDILPMDCVGRSPIPSTTDEFTYLPPKITSMLPANGTVGTLVVINGSGFLNGCAGSLPSLRFGAVTIAPGDPALVSATATAVKVHAPPQLAGKVDVRVIDCVGDTSAVVTADKFTYTAPKVTGLSPTSGHPGTLVTVKGSGFLIECSAGALPSVLFGSTAVPGNDPSVSSVTTTAIKLTAPTHATGVVDVRVQDCAGDVTAIGSVDKFTYR